jgi:hypothetical protein
MLDDALAQEGRHNFLENATRFRREAVWEGDHHTGWGGRVDEALAQGGHRDVLKIDRLSRIL